MLSPSFFLRLALNNAILLATADTRRKAKSSYERKRTMPDTMAQARSVLSTTAAHWLKLTETLPTDLLTRPPLPGEWSAAECLKHILDTERGVFPVRIRAILAGQDFVAFNPATDGAPPGHTPPQLAAGLGRVAR